MKDKQFLIEKSSGDLAEFSEMKLYRSLMHSGGSEEIANQIIAEIKLNLENGMSSRKIFRTAFKLLKRHSRSYASKYKLKEGIMELGPAGFAFEKFIAELMKAMGYSVQVGIIEKGYCVNHEVDVIAEGDNKNIYIECKYHNQVHIKCDVKVPLYIRSRYNDILKKRSINNFEGWVVTNTRFTDDSYTYGTCSGLHLLSWDQPKELGLKNLIDNHRLFPITCLTLLTKEEKEILLKEEVVLCKTLSHRRDLLDKIIKTPSRIENILKEVNTLLIK